MAQDILKHREIYRTTVEQQANAIVATYGAYEALQLIDEGQIKDLVDPQLSGNRWKSAAFVASIRMHISDSLNKDYDQSTDAHAYNTFTSDKRKRKGLCIYAKNLGDVAIMREFRRLTEEHGDNMTSAIMGFMSNYIAEKSKVERVA